MAYFQTSMLRSSMARKLNNCLAEGVVSYSAVEGLVCAHQVSYDGKRWANIRHGYPKDDKTSHPGAKYNKGGSATTAGQPTILICKAQIPFQLLMTVFLRHVLFLKEPFWLYAFGTQMGHKLPMPFFKKATILPTFLFLKPAQGGLFPDELFYRIFLSRANAAR